MKKFLTVAAIGALIAVSGCGKSDKSGAAASDGPVKREAGNWKTDVKLVKFEVPGMPAEAKDQMTKMMEGASGMDQCFTQEQVDKEDIAAELAKGPGNGGECKWSKKEVAGGKIDVAGTCTANGQTVDMAMAGTMWSASSRRWVAYRPTRPDSRASLSGRQTSMISSVGAALAGG